MAWKLTAEQMARGKTYAQHSATMAAREAARLLAAGDPIDAGEWHIPTDMTGEPDEAADDGQDRAACGGGIC